MFWRHSEPSARLEPVTRLAELTARLQMLFSCGHLKTDQYERWVLAEDADGPACEAFVKELDEPGQEPEPG